MDIAERISTELKHEQASIWYINDTYGAKIMVKITSSVIKSIMKGAKIEFLFGRDNLVQPAVIHKGIRIHDDPIHFLNLTGTNRFIDEHFSLSAILNRSYTYIHFHDELNVCVARAKLSFELKDQMKIYNMLGDISELYVGDFSDKITKSLDSFEFSLQMDRPVENVYEIDTYIIPVFLTDWEIVRNVFLGTDTNQITIDEKNEGQILEKQIQVVLEGLFRNKIYRNPQIKSKNNFREFTDIFACYENGIFLVETKALGVLNSGEERNMDRKVKGLKKQISKGINQLAGAIKKIHEGAEIFEYNKEKIEYEKIILPHGIVLVSELLPFGEWKDIEYKMFQAMTETKMYLNVMDFREFMQYIGHARGNRDLLNLMLIERVEQLVENQTIHMKLNVILNRPDEQ